jgi:hypothetical protein
VHDTIRIEVAAIRLSNFFIKDVYAVKMRTCKEEQNINICKQE